MDKKNVKDTWNEQSKNKKILLIGCASCIGIVLIMIIIGIITPKNHSPTTITPETSDSLLTETYTYKGHTITYKYPKYWKKEASSGFKTGHSNGMDTFTLFTYPIEEYIDDYPWDNHPTLDRIAAKDEEEVLGNHIKREITVDGVRGIEYIPTDQERKRIDVYFIKYGIVFDACLVSNNYDMDKHDFDIVIETLHVE
jgi:hypothetical protein